MTQCAVCHRPSETYLCGGCWTGLERQLGDCAWIAAELTTTLSRQDKMGDGSVKVGGAGEQPSPINLGAMEAGTRLRDILWSWCRDLQETNIGAPLGVEPTIVPLSRWLMRHPTWIAVHPAVDDLHGEIREAIRAAFRVIDRAPGKVYLGKCGAEMEGVECEEDLYGRKDARYARCRTCGTEWHISDRRQWMVEHIRDWLLTATEMSSALDDWLGIKVRADRIRQWAKRGQLAKHGERTDGGKVYPTYPVGAVLYLLKDAGKVA